MKYVDESDSELQSSDDQQPRSRPRRSTARPTVFEPLIYDDRESRRRSRDNHSRNHDNHIESRSTRSRRRFDTSPTMEQPRASRRSSNSRHHIEVPEDPSDIEEEEEEEEEEEGPRTYSLRDRSNIKRETLNISHLGGDGKTYVHDPHPHHVPRSYGTERPSYREPRLHLGRTTIPTRRHHHHHHHHRRHHKSYRRHFDSSSDSDSDSSSDRRRGNEDDQFRRHEMQRLEAERDSILPLSMLKGMGGSVMDKASRRDLLRADIVPVAVEAHIDFKSVGGLEKHVQALKEMVVLPLLYPDVFQQFDTQPPRGVLFCGPPGTGKTLTARALANSLSSSTNWSAGGKKVSFFMRKGADCLSKWVGEGERQLRLLFEQVSMRFIWNIDALCRRRDISLRLSFLMKLMVSLPCVASSKIRSMHLLSLLCSHSWTGWTREDK